LKLVKKQDIAVLILQTLHPDGVQIKNQLLATVMRLILSRKS